MRTLFELDKKDYAPNGPVRTRPSARAIIIKDDQVGMIYSQKYDYYKFPGGGIEADEDEISALKREVLEETGCHILADSVSEYGLVRRGLNSSSVSHYESIITNYNLGVYYV